MKTSKTCSTVSVTYRAMRRCGDEAELRLTIDPRRATVADAWRRLSKAYGDADPRTLEIEIRAA